MKHTIFIFLILASLFSFSQSVTSAKMETSVSSLVKHDTVNVVVRQYFDTIKVKIYYEEKEYIRVALGFEIRKIETTSSKPGGGTILDVKLFDDKWKGFTKTLFTVSQIL